MSHKQINTTFEVLLEQVEEAVGKLNENSAVSVRYGDYESARNLMQDAEGITFFRQKVRELQNEWQALFLANAGIQAKNEENGVLPRGLRTAEADFRLPILEVISDMGGHAEIEAVFEQVESRMEAVINDYDCESLPANPTLLRWKSTVLWCGNSMITEELLSNAQPGIWEITDKGQEYIATERNGEINFPETVEEIAETQDVEDVVAESVVEAETDPGEPVEIPPQLRQKQTVKRLS